MMFSMFFLGSSAGETGYPELRHSRETLWKGGVHAVGIREVHEVKAPI